MAVRLNVEPNTIPMRWRDYTATKPKRSIALDGYVSEGPRFNPKGPWANFNHHDGVSRLETRATCAQVLMALRMGMVESFRKTHGEFDVLLDVNDCDEDVSLSVALLRNPTLATNAIMNPLLNKLVFIEDMLDTTAGAYLFPMDLNSLREVMWVFNPYHRFRASGRLDARVAEEFRGVIDDIELRFLSYIAGKTGRVELDTRYEVIDRGSGWSFVREIGVHARVALSTRNIRAFVTMRERPDGRYVYTIARSSQFIPFPLPKIRAELNRSEGRTDGDLWGGGDNIIGSPRVHGSHLMVPEVREIIQGVLRQREE